MRISRVLIVSITALATTGGMSSGASAAPVGNESHIVAPYTTTYASGSTDCRPGAVCTPRSAADATGGITATMDMQRSVGETGTESGSASANQAVDVRVPKGATQLTATFHWTVRSASTTARADHGVAWASTALYANGSCTGCTTTDTVAALTSSSSTLPSSDNADSVSDVEKTLTVTIDHLPGKGTVRLWTGGSAYTEMHPMWVCTGLPGCEALPPTDPDRSGTAHAAVDAGLTSVDVTFTS